MDIMKRSGNVRCRSRGALVAALCAALACIPDVAGAQDDREGFYAGLHLGVALPTVVTSARRYVSHPTRCDVLLYPPSVSPPPTIRHVPTTRPGPRPISSLWAPGRPAASWQGV